jgi:hypothetical protein
MERKTMSALTLIIIRHAEKPNEAWSGPGLTIEGNSDDKSLVIRGWQRAGAWAALFGAGRGGTDFPPPGVIYAADPHAGAGAIAADDGPSQRPYETIKPLADRLGLKPVTTWTLGQEANLVAEIKQLSGVVLVCWEHKRIISGILPAIGLPDLPSKWGGLRFDVVLRFDRAAPGGAWSFRQLFPKLLSGDSDIPLGKGEAATGQ